MNDVRGYYSITWAEGEPTRLTGWCAGCGMPVTERQSLLVSSEPIEFPVFDSRSPLYAVQKPVGVWHAACAGIDVPYGEEVRRNGLVWRILTFPPTRSPE